MIFVSITLVSRSLFHPIKIKYLSSPFKSLIIWQTLRIKNYVVVPVKTCTILSF